MREPIHAWALREKGIEQSEWDAMVERAADQFLRETTPAQGPSAETYAELLARDRIAADELGGGVERIVAKALGWTSYEVNQ